MRRPTKPVSMCCVTIGYQDFILPFADGMKLVELMQRAFPAKPHYPDQHVVDSKPARVEFVSVRPEQIVRQSGAPGLEEL